MPTSLAYRAGATDIKPRSERHRETFEAGMKSFINEAKLLAQFDHPSLLKVYRFWEANGTAYMVMPFLEGVDRARHGPRRCRSRPTRPGSSACSAPLFDALAMLHASQIYHRDIAPDNMLLMADTGRPLLLDFGAARRVIGEMTQALTAILKPGYAPVEQYADMPGLKQGPWTDVYALAAVVHWIIMGKTPPPSVGRLFDDPYVPLAQSAAGRYSDAFLRAIDHALAVMPEKRTTSIEAMRVELFGDAMPAAAPIAQRRRPPARRRKTCRARSRIRGPETLRHEPTRQMVPPTEQRMRTEAEPAAPTPASSSKMPLVAGGVGLIVVAALAAFALWPEVDAARPTTTAPTVADTGRHAAPAASVATASAPMPTPVVATPRVDTPAVVAPAASAAPATVTTAPVPRRPRATPPPTEPARPTAAADPKPPSASLRRRARRRRSRAERPAAPVQARPAEPKPTDNSAECARIFQQISLGQADQATMDRLRVLRCR